MNYCLGFAFSEDAVLLIRKKKPDWQEGRLNGIGGKLEPGETPVEAMVREFAEECGVETQATDWGCFAVITGSDWRVVCFRAAPDNVGTARTTTEEEIVWVKHAELPFRADLLSNVDWLVALSRDIDLYDRDPVEIGYPD